jgi:thymidylate synthase
MIEYYHFGDAIAGVGLILQKFHHKVHTDQWQSIDISKNPQAEMAEILDVSFKVKDLSVFDNVILADEIKPNLPWADDHFLERVGGKPLNPGVQWANWPWASSADHFRTGFGDGPLISAQDWAYFSGFFDGEGTIAFHTAKGKEHKPPHIRLQIGQKFPESLYKIQRLTGIGTVVQKQSEAIRVLGGREYKQQMWRWAVGCHTEVSWILKNSLPYLVVKKDKAIKALEILENNPPSVRGSSRKQIWNKTWEPRFSHSYMSRYWPHFDNGERLQGMMFKAGDLLDVVDHMRKHPLTRQAYLPIWFPEDTGVVHGERVPCTLGYHFIMRDNKLHMTYYIRSCDFYRHFRDDLYLSVRLQDWMLEKLRQLDPRWASIQLGNFTFHCVSMHCFRADFQKLFKQDI